MLAVFNDDVQNPEIFIRDQVGEKMANNGERGRFFEVGKWALYHDMSYFTIPRH